MAEKLTHFKKLMNPNYLGSFAFDEGELKTVTIQSVAKEKVVGEGGASEECIVVHFAESGVLPMIFNATNCKTLSKLTKTPYIEKWKGTRIVLGVEKVKAFGDYVDAVRVKSLAKGTASTQTASASVGEIPCESCGKALTDASGMIPEKLAEYTKGKYGKVLCADCAKKAASK